MATAALAVQDSSSSTPQQRNMHLSRRSLDIGGKIRFHRRRRRSAELPAPAGTSRAKDMTEADKIELLSKFQEELVHMNSAVSATIITIRS